MKNLIENANLNVNSWLINWGLLSGHLKDGIFETTDFSKLNQWIGFSSNLFTSIKWSILLFYPKQSEMSNLLGDWAYFLGPKIIMSSMILDIAIHYLIVHCLFNLCSKHPKKMFYWLDSLEFDSANSCFAKLNLNSSDSKSFIKRISLLSLVLNSFCYPFMIFYAIVCIILAFKYETDYFFYYLISILTYCLQFHYALNCVFGLTVILYLVSLNWLSKL